MVADLVSDDVGIGKVAAGAQAPLHLVEEREIDIHRLISGTVERSRGRRGLSAARARRVAVDDHLRLAIFQAFGLEKLRPHVFRAGEDFLRKAEKCSLFFALHIFLLWRRIAGLTAADTALQHLERIAAHDPRQQRHDDHAANAERRLTAARHAAATASVFHIRAFSSSV